MQSELRLAELIEIETVKEAELSHQPSVFGVVRAEDGRGRSMAWPLKSLFLPNKANFSDWTCACKILCNSHLNDTTKQFSVWVCLSGMASFGSPGAIGKTKRW